MKGIGKNRKYFDKRHAARPLRSLSAGNQVWLRDRGATGTILHPGDTPRSYWVRTKDGTFRRNRRHLFLLPDNEPCAEQECQQPAEPADKTTNDASKSVETTPPSEPCASDHPSTSTQQTAPAGETASHSVTTRSGPVVKIPKRLGIND